MQTIKTAAIVIFMGTVIYGAYTSLTTPPETLPEDVQQLMFDNEPAVAQGQPFVDGLDSSIPDLNINSGEPVLDPSETFALNQTNVADSVAVAGPTDTGLPGAELPGAELPGAELAGAELAGAELPGAELGIDGAPTVPKMESAVTARLSDTPPEQPSRAYATTPQSFDLPDPNQVVADFANTGDQLQLPAVNPDLALASGTADARNNQSPPPGGDLSTDVVQASSGASNVGLANAIRTADRQYAADQRKEALTTLSIFYNTPGLSGEERASLLARLDPLAREVIYSKQHLLEKPYRVGQKETLVEIATNYEVPWQLLANINQVPDPLAILPGTELKVVTGPFRAEVNLSRSELTLFLGDLYAGRFPIAVGNDPTPKPGTFTIQDKQTEHTYYNRSGAPVPPGSPQNPYGGTWMDLGGQVCIHGSPDKRNATDQGCISLADDLAGDLYGILSQGSAVTIRR